MRLKQNILFALLFLLVHGIQADTSTIVLQNGLKGYTGCQDSYNFNQEPDKNYAEEIEIHTFNCVP